MILFSTLTSRGICTVGERSLKTLVTFWRSRWLRANSTSSRTWPWRIKISYSPSRNSTSPKLKLRRFSLNSSRMLKSLLRMDSLITLSSWLSCSDHSSKSSTSSLLHLESANSMKWEQPTLQMCPVKAATILLALIKQLAWWSTLSTNSL